MNLSSFFDPQHDDPLLLRESHYYDIDSYIDLFANENNAEFFSIFNTNARSLLKHKADCDVLLHVLQRDQHFNILFFY